MDTRHKAVGGLKIFLFCENTVEVTWVNFKSSIIVNEKGQKTAVILKIEDFEELLEDLHDLSIVAERRDEPTIEFEDLKSKLKADGLL